MNEALRFESLLHLGDFDIPLCNSNRPDGEVPKGIEKLDFFLEKSTAFVFAVPEAGGHYSAAFKNFVDWQIIKTRFNSYLGSGYTVSGKPIYLMTFTPTHNNSGGRHLPMTQYLLEEKLGGKVRQCHVFNRAWDFIRPGSSHLLQAINEQILNDLSQLPVLQAQYPNQASFDV